MIFPEPWRNRPFQRGLETTSWATELPVRLLVCRSNARSGIILERALDDDRFRQAAVRTGVSGDRQVAGAPVPRLVSRLGNRKRWAILITIRDLWMRKSAALWHSAYRARFPRPVGVGVTFCWQLPPLS